MTADTRTPTQITTDEIMREIAVFRSHVAIDRIVNRFRVTVLAEALGVLRQADSRDEAMRELTRVIPEGGQEQERKVP